MRLLYESFVCSAQELKKTRTLTVAGILLALCVVLSMFTLTLSQYLQIRFRFLPLALCSLFFGPVVGAVVGALSDFLGFLIRPTGPFMPGFMLNEALAGMLYGIFFYRRRLSVLKATGVTLLVTVFLNLGLTTLWLHLYYAKAFWPMLMSRLVKSIVLFPIDSALLFLVLQKGGHAALRERPGALSSQQMLR